jgi:hypothetical protein
VWTTVDVCNSIWIGIAKGIRSQHCLWKLCLLLSQFESWLDLFLLSQYWITGRGGVVMSNIYLATSLIYLACKDAGGVDPMTDECVNSDLTVHGMKPSALISNIALVSGLLSAFLMPVSSKVFMIYYDI